MQPMVVTSIPSCSDIRSTAVASFSSISARCRHLHGKACLASASHLRGSGGFNSRRSERALSRTAVHILNCAHPGQRADWSLSVVKLPIQFLLDQDQMTLTCMGARGRFVPKPTEPGQGIFLPLTAAANSKRVHLR